MDSKQRELLEGRNIEIILGKVDLSEYYSIRECAEVMDCSMGTVRKRVEKGEIPAKYLDLGEGRSRYIIPRSFVKVATTVKEVVELTRPMAPSELIGVLREENKELKGKVENVIVQNDRLIEQNRGLNARLIGMEEMMEMVMDELKKGKKNKPSSLWERLFG